MVASSMVRVVRFAGGLLFDRVMAGWDVVVHVADDKDARPMQILGARAVNLEHTLTTRRGGPYPQALAVDAELYRADPRVRRLVLEATGQCATEVRLWGAPGGPQAGAGWMSHRLSVAARAFKAHALAAAAAPTDSVDRTELFTSGEANGRLDAPVVSPAAPCREVS